MSGQHLTQSEYALQQVIVLFGKLLAQLAEAGITHTYRDVLCFCELENSGYLVLRYLNTGASRFEQWAEEWLHDREVSTPFLRKTVFEGDLNWRALAIRYKWLSLRIRRGKNEIIR